MIDANLFAPYDHEPITLTGTTVNPTKTADSRRVVGIFVGGAGNIVGQLDGATADATYAGLSAGTVLVGRFKSVTVSGTTATNLIFLYGSL